MNDDIESKNEQDISDLIEQSRQRRTKFRVATEDVADKLRLKINEIDQRKKEELTRHKAEEAGFGYIFLKGFPISPEALTLIPEERARQLKAICFLKTDTEFRIGALAPESPDILNLIAELEDETGSHGAPYIVSEQSLAAAMKIYATLPKIRKHLSGVEVSAEDLKKFQRSIGSFRELGKLMHHASTTDLYTIILAAAIQSNASDVHIEAQQDDIKIRYRIDGVLYDVATLEKKVWPKVVNRVKLLASLKINITDIPQDGRFTIYLENEFIDVRVSTVPSAYGESVVMRLLMSSAASLELEDIGLVGVAFDIMKKEIERPNGMIVTTGPTGSGKTTTLYAILKRLNKPESKIITLENPIEYRLKGITQSQVQASDSSSEDKTNIRDLLRASGETKRHFTYASGLRAVLRQDPDIVMVGEIRDHETAETAIQAALTGHLMLSTLHTNSAAGAIPRLVSMEVKPFLLAPAMNVIIGQRLVRRICKDCKEPYMPDEATLKRVYEVFDTIPTEHRGGITKENLAFNHGRGCQKCNNIGFKGRVGVFEILTMNEEIEKLILTGQVSEFQITKVASQHGMLTMRQDGILKAAQGITTPEEVFKATD
ncbi:MAG: GspE/PulE family protein [Patescibacteria group bacterium]|nr:GspE/PulE family protein [Patescibacteria group bacterium]MDD5715985.1 GspE/PulE family protein [Patescibacteria group bacterium]